MTEEPEMVSSLRERSRLLVSNVLLELLEYVDYLVAARDGEWEERNGGNLTSGARDRAETLRDRVDLRLEDVRAFLTLTSRDFGLSAYADANVLDILLEVLPLVEDAATPDELNPHDEYGRASYKRLERRIREMLKSTNWI